jgi:hypothetical protein
VGKLLISDKYIIFVFSSDINEKRKHVHVRDKRGRISNLCKIWLEPEIEFDYNYGFSSVEKKEIEKLITGRIKIITNQLNKFYAGKKVKSIIL